LVALIIVFATHQAALGLGVAGLSGMILLSGRTPLALIPNWLTDHAFPAFSSPWHLGALVFTLLLGAFAAILERGGGLLPLLLRRSSAPAHSQRRFLTGVFGLGLVCFFDGLANSLMVGRVARPLSDRLKIPRALLAYLVDTTSSAVACVAFISTWIATQLSLIADGIAQLPIDTPAYQLFLRSIPQNFYCIFALLLAFLTIRRNWLIGPMSRASAHAKADRGPLSDSADTKLWRALLPLLVLLLGVPLCFYILHRGPDIPPRFPVTLDKVTAAISSNVGPSAYVFGSFIALLAAALCIPPRLRRETPRIAATGALQLLPSLGILVLAWILGSILVELETAKRIAALLGDRLPLAAFPAAIFALGCITSFVSGSSWGTMGILMPLALPTIGPMALTQGLPPEFVESIAPAVIAAVFGGAVFGDHCSPYSDTTIVSALSCGVSTSEHTITQLPYALISASVSLGCGYLFIALGLNPLLALLLGTALLTAIVLLIPSVLQRDGRLTVD
jgi:Na+/H+ antiporter NhaC